MRFLLVACFLVVLGCGRGVDDSPHVTSFVGLSAFSAMSPNFPCDEYIEQANKSPMPIMPVLYGTFGFDWGCIEKFIESNQDRPHAVEIHFSNERCRFYQRCYEGEFEGSIQTEEFNHLLEIEEGWLLEAVKSRVAEILEGLGPVDNTQVFLSTGLEDLYSQEAYEVLYSVIREVWPYEVIRVPLEDDFHHELIEHHDLRPCTPDSFASNDGISLGLSEVGDYAVQHDNCKASILWLPALQGVGGEFTRPLDRVFRLDIGDVEKWDLFLTLLDG